MNDLKERLERIESLAELQKGWCEPEIGKPISESTIEFAKYVLTLLYKAEDTNFGIFPTPDGMIVFEWDDAQIEIWKE